MSKHLFSALSARSCKMVWAVLLFASLAPAVPGAPAATSAFTWTRPPGFTTTRGGDDGRILKVTTLAASGPGSLAAALAAEGPRTIVFTVGGVIDLDGRTLRLRTPHVTVAGETAPSPGITLIRGGLGISTHDVILRHLRVRPGEAGRAKKSGWDIDGIATGDGARDVIVDHCSVSWATDENLSASGGRFGGASPDDWRRNSSHRITFHRCLVAEGLRHSTHSKGTGHSMGSLIHDNATGIAIIGNLYLSNNTRNPLFKGGARGVVVNNLIHNSGGSAISYGLVPEEWAGKEWQRGQMAIVGNVIRRGPSTPAALAPIGFGSNWGAPECDAYVHDNRFIDRDGRELPLQLAVEARKGLERSGEFRLVTAAPLWPAGFTALGATEVTAAVLADVGARPWDRDAVDRRLVEEARSGGGKIIDSETEVGGYTVLGRAPFSAIDTPPDRAELGPMSSASTPRPVTVRAVPIELCQFLKFGGLTESGGSGKQAVAERRVFVNGTLETRKRRQLAAGDIVTFEGQSIVVHVA